MSILRRSCLTVPGNAPRMLEKARTLRADEVILDLEDAIAPQDRTEAVRRRAIDAVSSEGWQSSVRMIRVNAVGSPWFLDDIFCLARHGGRFVHGIVLPKIESPDQIIFVAGLLEHLECKHQLNHRLALEVQVESPRALVRLPEIASASPRIEALAFGPGDYAAAAGMPQLAIGGVDTVYPGDVWHYALSRIVTVARSLELQALDGPFGAIRDAAGLRASALRSRALGFDGKWVIHPDQIDICNEVFTPSEEQVNRARRLLREYDESVGDGRGGATLLAGEMVDEASRRLALRTVERAESASIVHAHQQTG